MLSFSSKEILPDFTLQRIIFLLRLDFIGLLKLSLASALTAALNRTEVLAAAFSWKPADFWGPKALQTAFSAFKLFDFILQFILHFIIHLDPRFPILYATLLRVVFLVRIQGFSQESQHSIYKRLQISFPQKRRKAGTLLFSLSTAEMRDFCLPSR